MIQEKTQMVQFGGIKAALLPVDVYLFENLYKLNYIA